MTADDTLDIETVCIFAVDLSSYGNIKGLCPTNTGPQTNSFPSSVIAPECLPVAILMMLIFSSPPMTFTGNGDELVDPDPRFPSFPFPIANTLWSAVRIRECSFPAATAIARY